MTNTEQTELTFEEGKYYKTRKGKVFFVCHIRKDTTDYPVIGYEIFTPNKKVINLTKNGNFINGSVFNNPNDLVEEFHGEPNETKNEEQEQEQLKLEVGKFYRLRDGTKALISFDRNISKEFGALNFLGISSDKFVHHYSWNHDGKHFANRQQIHDKDIIEEWVDPVKIVGYVNVYRNDDGYNFGELYYGQPDPKIWSRTCGDYVDTIKIEWEKKR